MTPSLAHGGPIDGHTFTPTEDRESFLVRIDRQGRVVRFDSRPDLRPHRYVRTGARSKSGRVVFAYAGVVERTGQKCAGDGFVR